MSRTKLYFTMFDLNNKTEKQSLDKSWTIFKLYLNSRLYIQSFRSHTIILLGSQSMNYKQNTELAILCISNKVRGIFGKREMCGHFCKFEELFCFFLKLIKTLPKDEKEINMRFVVLFCIQIMHTRIYLNNKKNLVSLYLKLLCTRRHIDVVFS